MKHPDENPLLKEILADEPLAVLRRTSLAQGLDVTNRARRRTRLMRVGMFTLLPVLLLLALTVPRSGQQSATRSATPAAPRPQPSNIAAASGSATAKVSGVTMISDEELFALFPGRSLALVGRPGQQQLVFLDLSTSH